MEDLDSLRFELGLAGSRGSARAPRAQTEDQGHDFARATALKTLREQEARGLSGLITRLAVTEKGSWLLRPPWIRDLCGSTCPRSGPSIPAWLD